MSQLKLWGGIQGMEPHRIGQIEVEYVVEGVPSTWTPLSGDVAKIRRHVERDRLAAGFRRQSGWWLDPWSFGRTERFDREAVRWALYRKNGERFEIVGNVWLVWASAEDLEGA